MLFSGGFFGRSRKPAGPRGHRAYAVGDIHGRLDLLDEMLALIEADIASRPAARNVIIFLGDLIDRGPQSAQVVERLRLYSPLDARTVFLMGNHEEVLLRVLRGEEALLIDWLQFGGAECVDSYGLDPTELRALRPKDAIERLCKAVPDEHVRFLESFADTLAFGSYLFVHAGIRPGIGLAEQDRKDLRWIRDPFLGDVRDHGCIVVHGHTITPDVDECPNRIGIDTGAYRTGVLTVLAVERAQRWLLRTGGDIGAEAEVSRVPKGFGLQAKGSRQLA